MSVESPVSGVEVKSDSPHTTRISRLIMMACIWICFSVVALFSVIVVTTLYIGGLPFVLTVGLIIAVVELTFVILVILFLIREFLKLLSAENEKQS